MNLPDDRASCRKGAMDGPQSREFSNMPSWQLLDYAFQNEGQLERARRKQAADGLKAIEREDAVKAAAAAMAAASAPPKPDWGKLNSYDLLKEGMRRRSTLNPDGTAPK